MGFNTVKIGDPDYLSPGSDCRASLRAARPAGCTASWSKAQQIANAAETGNNAGRYPGWFTIQVELLKDKGLEEADKLALAELKRLRDVPVGSAELKRVKQQLFASFIFNRESVHNLGDSIARGVTNNDLNFLKTYLSRIAAVTPEEIQKAAQKYLDPEQRVEIRSLPHVEKKGAEWGSGKRSRLARAGKEPGTTSGLSLERTKRVVLPNGLTLLLFENRRLPIVVAEALVRNVRLREPTPGIATLTGRMLDEGTTKHGGPEIAEMIESVGGVLGLSASGGGVKVLSPNRSLGLGLLFECLSEANFPKDAFERQKQQQLSEIADAEQRPDAKAVDMFRALAYGKHPFGQPSLGTRKTVEKLTAKDCKAFYRELFKPNNTIVAIVGDFDSKLVIDEVAKLTAGWKKGPAVKPMAPAVTMPAKFTEKILTMPAAAQLHFYLGHPGITRNNPDYYKLLVLDNILGTGPGLHRPPVGPAAGPRGAGLYRIGEHHLVGHGTAGIVHLLHRNPAGKLCPSEADFPGRA